MPASLTVLFYEPAPSAGHPAANAVVVALGTDRTHSIRVELEVARASVTGDACHAPLVGPAAALCVADARLMPTTRAFLACTLNPSPGRTRWGREARGQRVRSVLTTVREWSGKGGGETCVWALGWSNGGKARVGDHDLRLA